MHGTSHHLFLFAGISGHQIPLLIEIATQIEQRFHGVIKANIVLSHIEMTLPTEYVSVLIDENQEMHQRFKLQQATTLLIRPDQYIGLTQSPVDKNELINHMEQSYFQTNPMKNQ
ncbi:MAG: hypothetical protein ACRCXC_08920 [Legionella sp.]